MILNNNDMMNKHVVNKATLEIPGINYIILSDIDDTLYANTLMTKKVSHAHALIKYLGLKHNIFISARPDISLLKYITKWRLAKDFNNFTLLMGSVRAMIYYAFLRMIYLLTLKKMSCILTKAQQYIGNKKIQKITEYIKNNHARIFSEKQINCIIFMGDNIQGDVHLGEYIIMNMNNEIVCEEARYKVMSLVLIRDAARKYTNGYIDKYTLIQKNNISGIYNYNNYKNMFITGLECNIKDILFIVNHYVCEMLNDISLVNKL